MYTLTLNLKEVVLLGVSVMLVGAEDPVMFQSLADKTFDLVKQAKADHECDQAAVARN